MVYTNYNRRTDAEILQELRRIFGEEENGEGRYVYFGGESNAPENVDNVVWEEPYRDEVESAEDNVDVMSDNAGVGTLLYSADHEGHGGKVERHNELKHHMSVDEQTVMELLDNGNAVSYTHLTLPTIYSV